LAVLQEFHLIKSASKNIQKVGRMRLIFW